MGVRNRSIEYLVQLQSPMGITGAEILCMFDKVEKGVKGGWGLPFEGRNAPGEHLVD